MSNLKTTNDVVLFLLQTNQSTRNSDSLLYNEVCKIMNPMVQNMTFGYVMEHRQMLGIPTTETVRRARQKLQADHPELGCSTGMKQVRTDLEHEYRNYAVGGN